MIQLLVLCIASFLCLLRPAGPVTQPGQPESGPGGTDYRHDTVKFTDYADDQEGFWLFEPDDPKPDSAHLVVFVHGYGGYNPMIYGQWIKHLVRKGNMVLYPRYQQNIFSPHPKKFASNVSRAFQRALTVLDSTDRVKPILSHLALVGHSYGGVIIADLAVNYREYEIPAPGILLLCAPGTGKLNGGRLDSYEKMPEDLSMVIISHENDWVVGDEFAKKIFSEATAVSNRVYLKHLPDSYGEPEIKADHNQAYSVDLDYDSGMRNYTTKKALRVSTVDPVDYFGYWKILDAMLACSREGTYCDYAYQGAGPQVELGSWSDGTPIRRFEAIVPE